MFNDAQSKILALKSEDIGRGHAERLMGLLQQLLHEAQLSYYDVELIAVTIGPGSFTGIRVGIATARGLALGLKVPVIGINVLEAIAFQHQQDGLSDDNPLVVAMDARRSEYYVQMFDEEKNSVPAIIQADKITAYLPVSAFRIAGSAARLVVNDVARQDIYVCSNQTAVDIESVARLAASRPVGDEKPKPLYLRPAGAKPQINFAIEHAAASGRG